MKILVEFQGNEICRRIELNRESYSLGRDEDCDLVFDLPRISRKHAFLTQASQGYIARDNDSSNHIYVNGDRVDEKLLESGDILSIARKVTLLYIDEDHSLKAFDRLVEKLWKRVKKEDFLRLKEVTGRISALDGLDSILRLILSEAIRFVGAARGLIALADKNGKLSSKAFVTQSMPFKSEEAFLEFISQSAVERALESRESVIIENTKSMDEHSKTSSVIELALGSLLCFPLLFNDRLVGILYVDSPDAVILMSEMDPFYYRILADHAAIAIGNAKLFERLEGRIKESEERYQNLVELSPDAIMLQVDGNLSFVNSAGLKLLEAKDFTDRKSVV